MQTVTRTGFLACLLVTCFYAQPLLAQKDKNGFTIEGTIKDFSNPPAFVYLVQPEGNPGPTDSARVINGKYTFKSSTEEVQPFRISALFFDNVTPPRVSAKGGMATTTFYVTVYANKGDKIKIVSTGTMKNAVVTGTEADRDYHEAYRSLEQWGDTLKKTYELAKETNNKVLEATIWTESNLLKVQTLTMQGITSFVRSKPASPINLVLLKQLIPMKKEAGWVELVEGLYKELPATTRTSAAGKALGDELAMELKVALGHKAMDFSQANTQGQPVSLASFKGKYVLLYFWASWDETATGMLPLITRACDVYGSKGLTGLSVSLDDNKESWLQAIKDKEAANITNVSDLKGKENEVARLYGIKKLPGNLLIDPNGVIVARNLDQFSLSKTLTSIFE